MTHERRSGWPARPVQQLDLDLGDEGVGARQASPAAPAGGGGYLDECSPSEIFGRAEKFFAKIAKVVAAGGSPDQVREATMLAELADMGLPGVLLQVAEAIGFDAFMKVWQLLDTAPELLDESGSGIQLRMPRFRAWRRYQRNRYIETLAGMGYDTGEIKDAVRRQLGEEISNRHTRRLRGDRRAKI